VREIYASEGYGMAVEIRSGIDKIDLKKVVSFLRKESYWAKRRTPRAILKSIDNSPCYSVYKDGRFAGFARMVTDYSTFYYLCDVFILKDFRGMGLGERLVRRVVRDPRLKNCMGMLLTRDAHRLYSRYGFTAQEKERKMFMIKRGLA
jgi:GNAT superfamily N-acetyltransferase